MLGLLSLPEQIWVPIYSEWITLVDIARLSSATCNKRHREAFLRLVFNGRTVLTNPETRRTVKIHSSMNEWIIQKNVCVSGLVVASTLLQDEGIRAIEYFHTHGARLQWITFLRVVYPRDDMCWLSFAVDALQLCPNIRRLEYSGLECDVPENLTDHCRQLEELRLKGVVKGACLDAIAENCPHLKKLDINSVTGLSESTILTLLRCCSGLVNLSPSTGANITDSTVLGIVSYGSHLVELQLHNALSLSTRTLAVLFTQCLNLRTFGLASSTVFFDHAAQFPPQCPITKLDFKDVFMTDHSFGLILEGCPALLGLSMEACMDINSDALFLIAKCQRLQKLSLEICFVTDRVLEEVALGCGQLTEIALTGHLQISETGVGALAHGCPLLQRITSPRHCREITDAAVLALAQNCPSLCLLEVGVGVTDAGMTAAAAAAPMRSNALTIKRW